MQRAEAAAALPLLLVLAGTAGAAPAETLTPLLRQDMPNLPGKTLTAVQVVFPPRARAAPHRHGSAFLYAYVLAGTVRSEIEGQPVRTYRTGESWTERPGDHHVLTDNPSGRVTARLLVVFIADTGSALKIDDNR